MEVSITTFWDLDYFEACVKVPCVLVYVLDTKVTIVLVFPGIFPLCTDICRVCRLGPAPNRPLFHPCMCIGSIGYVHQDWYADICWPMRVNSIYMYLLIKAPPTLRTGRGRIDSANHIAAP